MNDSSVVARHHSAGDHTRRHAEGLTDVWIETNAGTPLVQVAVGFVYQSLQTGEAWVVLSTLNTACPIVEAVYALTFSLYFYQRSHSMFPPFLHRV